MAAYFTGNGIFGKNMNTFVTKNLAQKKSVLGDKNSIFEILQGIRNNLSNGKSPLISLLKNINTNVKDIDQTFNKDLDLLNIIQETIKGFSQNNESSNNFDEFLTDLKVLFADSFDELEQKINEIKLDKQNSENQADLIKPWVESNEKLFKINQDLRENKEKQLVEGKLKLIIEGLDGESIEELIKFSELNLENISENGIAINNFLNALQKIDKVDFKILFDQIESIENIFPNLNKALEKLELLRYVISKDSIQALEDIFGNGKRIGFINRLIRAINRVEIIEGNKTKDIIESLKNATMIFTLASSMFLYVLPLQLAYKAIHNSKWYLSVPNIFIDLNNIFRIISKLNTIDENKRKEIIDSLNIINAILTKLIKTSTLTFGVSKIFNYEKTYDIFDDIRGLYGLINLFKKKDLDIKEKLDLISNNMDSIDDILKGLAKMKFISIAAKFSGRFSVLDNLFKDLRNSFQIINSSIKKPIDKSKIEDINESIQLINSSIISLIKMKWSSSIGKIGNLDDVVNLFIGDNNSVKYLIEKILEEESFKQQHNKEYIEIITSLGYISIVFDNLSKISNTKIKKKNLLKNLETLEEYIVNLEKVYNEIKDKFNDIIATSELVAKVKQSNQIINEGLENCNETVVKTSSKSEDIKKGTTSLEGLTSFMIGAAIVMSIGALFMSLGGGKFVKNALEFGITLMIFETLVIAPMLLFSEIQTEAFKSLNNLNSFVITCTVTLLIGALFMNLGGGEFVKNALAFGLVLGMFEMLVIAPFLAFTNNKSKIMKGLESFSDFLITCTIVMSVGALFMNLGGGKFAKNALRFGVLLATFELLLVSPFIMFSLIKSQALDGMRDFTALVITCTTILLIGALFMSLSNGKLMKNGIKFAETLMMFEALIIAPFLIMNLLKSRVFDGMRAFNAVAISCTILLMIGALFVSYKNGALINDALKFTGLLMLFEVGIIAPMLLFNLIKGQLFKGLIGFTAAVIVCTAVLMIGGMFMTLNNGEYASGALEFTGLLAAFTLAIGIIAVILSKWLGKNTLIKMQEFNSFVLLSSISLLIGAFFVKQYGKESVFWYGLMLGGFVALMGAIATKLSFVEKDIPNMVAFGVFVLLSSTALLTGALFVKNFGVETVISYGLCLLGFVTLMGGALWVLAFGFNSIGGIPMADALIIALGGFLILATTSLILGAWFINTYGAGPVLKYGGLLLLFTTLMGGVFMLLGALGPFIAIGSVVAIAMGAALLTLTTSLIMANAYFILDPGGKKLNKNLDLLKSIICSRLPWIFVGLGVLSPLIALGSASAILIGTSMLILSGSFELINLMMGQHGEELKKNIGILNGILGWDFLASTYALLGVLSPLIALGSASAILIGTSMLILSGSFELINLMMGEHGTELQNNINTLNTLLGFSYLAGTYTLLGALSILIIPGSLAAMAIGTSMMILGGAFRIIDDIKTDNLLEQLGIISLVLVGLGGLATALVAFTPIAGLALTAIGILNIFSLGISSSLMIISHAIDEISKDGDMKMKIAQATENVKQFINMPISIFENSNILKVLEMKDKIDELKDITNPMGEVIKSIGTSINDLANFKVAIGWDDKGNPIKYRQLKNEDFNLANDNIEKILVTMAQAFYDTYNGADGKKGIKDFNDDELIEKVITFGKGAGEVISGMSLGISTLAKLQVPIGWDDHGNPINFRQLNANDFINAGLGVATILTCIADAFNKVYNDNQNLFNTDDEDSIFNIVLNSSMKISELLGNIGQSVGDIAKLQIPIEWDKNGKVIGYRTLKAQDFKEMGLGVGKILTAVITEISNLYYTKENGINLKEIFDLDESKSGFWSKLMGGEQQTPFEKVLGFSFKISELLSKVASGVKDLAKLQIPIYKDGKIVDYERLTAGDFEEMGQSVGQILTAVANKVGEIKQEPDKINSVLEALQPASELISGVAEGIVKLASNQIPDEWDPKTGKPKHYIRLDDKIYTNASIVIGDVLKTISNALITLAKDKNGINEIFTDGTFKEITDSLSQTTGLISSVTDSIIKLGSAQIPVYKNGKIDHYDPLDIEKAKTSLTNTLSDILFAVSQSIIDVFIIGQSYGMFTEDPGSGNTKFDIAIRGITGVTKIVSGITDSIVKLGTSLVPDKWDPKTGNPLHYKTIVVKDVIKNLKDIFIGQNNEQGLLLILGNIIKTASETYDTNKINEKTALLETSIKSITKIISDSTSIIVDISSLKIPTGFDKDGNATGYNKLSPKDITNAKDNVIALLNNILGIPTDEKLNKLLDKDKSNQNKDKICGNIADIDTIINSIKSNLDNVKTLINSLDSIYKYEAKSKISAKETGLSIGAFRDIYSVLYNYQTLINLINQLDFSNKLNPIDLSIKMNFDQLSPLSRMNDLIGEFIQNGINPFTDDAYKRASLLNDTINKLYNTTNNQEAYGENFKNNSVQLSNYITSINRIDISKTNSLTMLVRELNKLSARMGNLDGLTNAIAEKLSTVLEKLINSLNEAKDTINTADTIQTKRHNAIQKTIREVKEIMDNPISIKVSSDTTESQDDESNYGNSSTSPIGGQVGTQSNNSDDDFPKNPSNPSVQENSSQKNARETKKK